MRLRIEIDNTTAGALREFGETSAECRYIVRTVRNAVIAMPSNYEAPMPSVLDQIGNERLRQRIIGHTLAHDDTHTDGELAEYAAVYALAAAGWDEVELFAPESWKQPDTLPGRMRNSPEARRYLIKAAALLVAEIERIDRAANAVPA